jgi:hypothetical protein
MMERVLHLIRELDEIVVLLYDSGSQAGYRISGHEDEEDMPIRSHIVMIMDLGSGSWTAAEEDRA